MVFNVFLFGFVALFFGTPAVSTCIDYERTAACDAVFSPEAIKEACCPPTRQLVELNAKCQRESCSDKFTCSVSQCVAEAFGILTNNEIDECKARAVNDKFNKENPANKPLNDEVEKNCLNGQYKQYVTNDTNCDIMKYQVCVNVNYLMACQKFKKSSSYCKWLSANVATCKPYLQQYLKQINP